MSDREKWIEVACLIDSGKYQEFICNLADEVGLKGASKIVEPMLVDRTTLDCECDDPWSHACQPRVLLCLLFAAMTDEERAELCR